VSYVASVTLAALREGRRVTLIAGSGGPTVPRTLDATSVLDFFAGIDKAGKIETDVARAAARTVHPGGTMLFLRGANSQLQIRTDGAATCCHREVLDA
jgi:hypothetical protein